jgi:hypothetical protein
MFHHRTHEEKNARSHRSLRAVVFIVMFVVSIAVGLRLRQFRPYIRSSGFSKPLRTEKSWYSATASDSEPDGIKFIFIVGLEGSGHNRLGMLLRESASAVFIDQRGLRERVSELQDALYSNIGLFYQHCKGKSKNNSEIFVGGPTTDVSEDSSDAVTLDKLGPVTGPNETFHRAVHLFRGIVKVVGEGSSINIPLNADGYVSNQGSYPQDNDSCRMRKYPDLALLYEVCKAARVECRHAYLTTSVEALLYSAAPAPLSTTQARHPFLLKPLKDIFLYTTLLDIQFAQIAYFPNQTIACLDLSSDGDDSNQVDAAGMSTSWQSAVNQMFGLSVEATGGGADRPSSVNVGEYKPGGGLKMANKGKLDLSFQMESHDDNLYLQSFRASHKRTLEFCQATLRHLRNHKES